MNSTSNEQKHLLRYYKIVVVGAGAAGIGVGVTLKDFGLEDFIILEKNSIGSSFLGWNRSTRFITPSFQSTQFGLLDLNAVAINTSPAYSSGKEHLTGEEYAHYLNRVVYEFQLPVHEERGVGRVEKTNGKFHLETENCTYICDYLIWATGEFQFPALNPFRGAHLAIHIAKIKSYENFQAMQYTIIGGYESGIDTALQLAARGKQVTILEKGKTVGNKSQDPSVALSFFTRQRLDESADAENIFLEEGVNISEIKLVNGTYHLYTENGHYESPTQPLLATGYSGGEYQISDLFTFVGDRPQLNQWDESIRTENLFLAGPHVMHNDVIFCFIYKFRQRFAIIAGKIAKEIGINSDAAVQLYKKHQMYLEDLTCCQENCKC